MTIFQVPDTSVPAAKTMAAGFLGKANQIRDWLLQNQKGDFKAFWYESDQETLKSAALINSVLDEMDLTSPGQSAKYFQAAYATAQLLLALDPTCLVEADYLPPKPYTVDPVTYHVTVTD